MTAVQGVSVDASDLADAVAAVAPFTSSRNHLTIVSHVHVVASKGELRLEAMDGEAFVSRTIQADGDLDTCLSAKALSAACKSLTGNSASFETKGSTVVLSSGRYSAKLPFLDGGDYPTFPVWDGDTEPVRIARNHFAALLKGPSLAASTDEHREILRGVKIEREGEALIAAATDTHRVHVSRGDFLGGGIEGVLPVPFIRALSSFPGDEFELRRIRDGKWMARMQGAEAAHLAYHGEFAPWRRVVPENPETRAIVSRVDLADAVRRVMATVQPIRVVLDTSVDGGVSIYGKGDERGDAEDFVAGQSQMGADKIAFNPKYLLDALSTLDGDDVTISFEDHTRPAKFTGSGEGLAVIMPMALDGGR